MGLPTPSPLGRLMTLTAAHISLVPWPSCSQTRGLKVPWQPRSRRTNVCCSGSVLSYKQDICTSESGTQPGTLSRTGDQLASPPLQPWEAPPQCSLMHPRSLCGTACAWLVQVMGKARAPSTQTLFSLFYLAHSSTARLFISWPNSHHQLLGTIQSSFVTGGWFLGHIWMAGR